MKRILKLTESDLVKIVKKVIKEQQYSWGTGIDTKSQIPTHKADGSPIVYSDEELLRQRALRGYQYLGTGGGGYTTTQSAAYNPYQSERDKEHFAKTGSHQTKSGVGLTKEERAEITHNVLMIASLASAFIPLVGPFISAGIQLADAGMYYQDGNTEMAGMSAMFALIPGAGKLLSKLPILKNINPNLLTKWKSGKPISKAEAEALDVLGKNISTVRKELGEEIVKQSDELLKKPTLTQSAKTALTNVAKSGLNFTIKTTTTMAPYVVAGAVYDKAYDYMQSETPSALAAKENIDWNLAKSAFGSSGSLEDNKKLQQAWKEGWRPGTVVPEKYRTLAYSKQYNEEQENLKNLDVMLAQYE
jgi:hypothetical protein